ncbi:hypothetical protein [Streptomyces albospinus]|uniref:hypothetical protein n=1 Tax=Streptomyces albospinus TaxID=285515 RepID=UPI00167157DE|nr:hypothetical protein [Streptomyces albospinus]
MFVKPGLDDGVELGDLLFEGRHPFRAAGDLRGGQLLSRQCGVLSLGSRDGGL